MDRHREHAGWKQSQSPEGGEDGTHWPCTPLPCTCHCFLLALLVCQRAQGAAGSRRAFSLTPSLPRDRAPKHTDILFCAEKCTQTRGPRIYRKDKRITRHTPSHSVYNKVPRGFRSTLPHSIWGAGKSFSTSNLCPSSCRRGRLGATRKRRCSG